MKAAYIKNNATRIHEAMVVLVVNAGAVIGGGNSLSAVEARDKFRGLTIFELE